MKEAFDFPGMAARNRGIERERKQAEERQRCFVNERAREERTEPENAPLIVEKSRMWAQLFLSRAPSKSKTAGRVRKDLEIWRFDG
jgi:hypothetical protein